LKLNELLEICNEIAPFELQASWDNSGMVVGSSEDEIEHIYLALDIDEEQLLSLPEKSVVIAHHPLIFGKLNKIDFSTYPAKYLKIMIQKNISHIAMHTNFDLVHLNRYVGDTVLGLIQSEQDEHLLYGDSKFENFDEILEDIQKRLGLETIKYVKSNEKIRRVALCTGAGASLLEEVKADLFLTGDIKYHEAMHAKALGISLIDITHYTSEKYFSTIMMDELKKKGILAIIANSKDPFNYKQEKA
jgi:GTP cyclohydrolase I